jgi:hypothetical protein
MPLTTPDVLKIMNVSMMQMLIPTHALPVIQMLMNQEPKIQLMDVLLPPHQSSHSQSYWLLYWLPSSSDLDHEKFQFSMNNIKQL